ncbi:MAG TPA: carboxypeptidase-like regulatory domain-containing protein, partial [Chitinophagaceae bacterium]|nr:carboxypeptidase-like regulatory domain-containing protein [Chitinophagaceae bacterium]
MIFRSIVTALLFLSICCEVDAQSILKGKIYEAQTDSAIVAVNVYNLNTKHSVRSGIDGSYIISAAEGEQIVFSMAGFKPDTLTVTYSMLLTEYDVTLHKQVITLKNVTVTNSYQADSLARRNYYSNIYDKQPGLTGHNTPASGFGIVLSPLSYFSPEARQKRRLKKRLIKEEREDYINRSFPIQWVEK